MTRPNAVRHASSEKEKDDNVNRLMPVQTLLLSKGDDSTSNNESIVSWILSVFLQQNEHETSFVM